MTISDILLNPGNRLLQGGTADLAMFGGQPAVTLIGRPQASDGGYVSAFSRSPTETPVSQDRPSTDDNASFYTGSPSATAADNDALSATIAPALSGLHAPPTVAGPSTDPLTPTGSGSLASAPPIVSPLAATEGQASPTVSDGLANAFHAPVLDAAVSPLADSVALASGLAGASLTPVLALADGVATGAVTTTLQTTADTLAVADQLGTDAVAGLTGTVDQVGSLADEGISTVAGASGDILDIAHDGVTATVMPLVDHLAGTDDAAGGADDLLAGVDPAGGIATLTAMVGSSDVFEVAGGTVDTTLATTSSALDAVPVDGEAVSPLLGEDHGVDGLLNHDDGHIGIGPL